MVWVGCWIVGLGVGFVFLCGVCSSGIACLGVIVL